jgi:hypothetical protein
MATRERHSSVFDGTSRTSRRTCCPAGGDFLILKALARGSLNGSFTRLSTPHRELYPAFSTAAPLGRRPLRNQTKLTIWDALKFYAADAAISCAHEVTGPNPRMRPSGSG